MRSQEKPDFCRLEISGLAQKLAEEHDHTKVADELLRAASKLIAQGAGYPTLWRGVHLALSRQAMLWADKINAGNN